MEINSCVNLERAGLSRQEMPYLRENFKGKRKKYLLVRVKKFIGILKLLIMVELQKKQIYVL